LNSDCLWIENERDRERERETEESETVGAGTTGVKKESVNSG
jgi:hypothetical protein